MSDIVSEIRENTQIKSFKIIMDNICKDGTFFLSKSLGYKQKVFLHNNLTIASGRTVEEFNSPKKPQKRTKEKFTELHSLLNPKIPTAGIPTGSGFYMFIAKENFDITIKEVFYDFISLQLDGNEIVGRLLSTPKINSFLGEKILSSDDSISILKHEIVYVGQAKNIYSRYSQHWSSKLDKTSSMKLGRRNKILENVDFYCQVIPSDSKYKKGDFESYVRNFYGSRFGQ